MVSEQNAESYSSRADRLFARRQRDWTLMARVATGDGEALQEIWRLYRNWLSYHLFQKGILDPDQVHEILQEVRRKIEKFAHKYDREIQTVGTWFALITDNVLYQRKLEACRQRDNALMVRVVAGDHAALQEIWGYYRSELSARLVGDKGIKDPDDVGGILSEVRRKIRTDANLYDSQASSVCVWFSGILDNVVSQRSTAAPPATSPSETQE